MAAVGTRLLVYLDQADLANIADGKACFVGELRDALSECCAHLLVSSAHLLDLGKANAATKTRWSDAVASLGTIRFAGEPGVGHEIAHDEIRALLNHTAADVAAFTQVATVRQDAASASRDAHLAAPSQLSPAELRRIVESMLDGTVGETMGLNEASAAAIAPMLTQMQELLASSELDREAILSALTPQLDPILAAGDLGEFVRVQRSLNRRRKPRFSDLADEIHMTFAVYADVVTVDGNVAHSMRSAVGKTIPVDRRSSTAQSQIVFLPCGDLGAVVRVMHSLADCG